MRWEEKQSQAEAEEEKSLGERQESIKIKRYRGLNKEDFIA